MEREEVLQLMQGNYLRLVRFGPKSDEYANIIKNDTISFHTGLVKDPKNNWNTVAFSLERNTLTPSIEAWNIKLAPEFGSNRNDSIFHIEDVDGHRVRFISDTAFEYDGRGLIVISTMVHEDDRSFVTDDFETKLYTRLNNSKPTSTMNPFFGGNPPIMAMGMMGSMFMAQNMSLNVLNPGAPAETTSGETVTCPACKMQVTKANFCRECGAPLK